MPIREMPHLNRQKPRDSGRTVRSLKGTSSSWYLRQIRNNSEVPAASDQTRVRCYRMVLSLPPAMPRAEVPCLSAMGRKNTQHTLRFAFQQGWKGRCGEPQLQPPVPSSTQPRCQDGRHPVTQTHGHEGGRWVTSHPRHVHRSTSQSHPHLSFIPIRRHTR